MLTEIFSDVRSGCLLTEGWTNVAKSIFHLYVCVHHKYIHLFGFLHLQRTIKGFCGESLLYINPIMHLWVPHSVCICESGHGSDSTFVSSRNQRRDSRLVEFHAGPTDTEASQQKNATHRCQRSARSVWQTVELPHMPLVTRSRLLLSQGSGHGRENTATTGRDIQYGRCLLGGPEQIFPSDVDVNINSDAASECQLRVGRAHGNVSQKTVFKRVGFHLR